MTIGYGQADKDLIVGERKIIETKKIFVSIDRYLYFVSRDFIRKLW